MRPVTVEDLRSIYVAAAGSHKGQNGRLLVIGGSHLFHAASLWALTVASRIVDLVHYSSVPENNELVAKAKEEFRNGIVVPREQVEEYIQEDDCILIGPGMERNEETEALTNSLLRKYPQKQWVIDAGALQMLDLAVIPKNAILTPHHGEFKSLSLRAKQSDFSSGRVAASPLDKLAAPRNDIEAVKFFVKQYQCTILLKGQRDIACSGGACDGRFCTPSECRVIEGGNAGMTKGGTGDVLAGLIAALVCKNDPFLATIAGSFINKQAAGALYEKVGAYFNATDLANQIPLTMKKLMALISQ